MPSFTSLPAALCLLCLTLPLRAEPPLRGGRLTRTDNDSRPNDPSREMREKWTVPEEVGGKTYNEWKRDLSHSDPYARIQAIMALLAFGEQSAEAVPTLTRMLQRDREDGGVKAKVLLAFKIMKINEADKENTVKAVAHTIANDTQSIIRYEAACTIARFGEVFAKSPELRQKVVADLVKGLGDTSTCEMRKACITALIVAGVDPKEGPEPRVTDALILRTKPYWEPSKLVRLEAIIALGAMGRPHDPKKLSQVLGALREHYRSTDKAIKIWTHVSLMALDDKIQQTDVNMIVKYLNDPDREVRKHAVTALGALEKKTAEHVKEICTLLETEKETMVQEAACSTLARMGDKSPDVLRTLIQLTTLDKRKNSGVVLAACATLAHLHVANPKVMAAMKAVLKHNSLSEQELSAVEGYITILESPVKEAPKPKGKLKEK
ncbi:MAG TPA: HEAT repeat domain-containing protein [Gemmataceae bacterium]